MQNFFLQVKMGKEKMRNFFTNYFLVLKMVANGKKTCAMNFYLSELSPMEMSLSSSLCPQLNMFF